MRLAGFGGGFSVKSGLEDVMKRPKITKFGDPEFLAPQISSEIVTKLGVINLVRKIATQKSRFFWKMGTKTLQIFS